MSHVVGRMKMALGRRSHFKIGIVQSLLDFMAGWKGWFNSVQDAVYFGINSLGGIFQRRDSASTAALCRCCLFISAWICANLLSITEKSVQWMIFGIWGEGGSVELWVDGVPGMVMLGIQAHLSRGAALFFGSDFMILLMWVIYLMDSLSVIWRDRMIRPFLQSLTILISKFIRQSPYRHV